MSYEYKSSSGSLSCTSFPILPRLDFVYSLCLGLGEDAAVVLQDIMSWSALGKIIKICDFTVHKRNILQNTHVPYFSSILNVEIAMPVQTKVK